MLPGGTIVKGELESLGHGGHIRRDASRDGGELRDVRKCRTRQDGRHPISLADFARDLPVLRNPACNHGRLPVSKQARGAEEHRWLRRQFNRRVQRKSHVHPIIFAKVDVLDVLTAFAM